ncbi:unnamed protein product [Cuscuta campestris]|uniref:Uncharacterized protein n=1 Tax=Cuscuta campestris TaxID=132261 RepID=A0A484LJQ0_9ASTE|nr:unnamed protein product [Cuscuta campestris]
MGTEDERLTALKKAYADIILNTSKEAAARIMASEQKALRLQHELQVVKEDALRTMLRIKQIMDSKISEAETTRLSQQRKIDELEAQLHEAEDIVSDLRGELREAHDALERVKINKESRESAFCASDLHDVHVEVSDIRIMNPSARSEGLKSCSRALHHTGSSYLSHPDLLPSIILRSKEPELYRNGCTQRIRACEGNMLGKKQSISQRKSEEVKPESDGRNASNDCKEVSAVPDAADKKVAIEAGSFVFSGSFQRKKRRAKRCAKSRVSLGGIHPPAPLFPMKTDEGQINNNSSSSFDDDGDGKKEEKLAAFLKSSSHRKRKIEGRQRKHRAPLEGNLPVPGKDSSEVTPISSPDRDGSQRECHGVEKAVSEHEGLVEANVLAAVLETGSTGSSGITVHNKSDVEDAVVALLQSSKVCEVAAPKEENRTFKYTFQRKRKRGENAAAAAADSVHKNCIEVMKNEEENQSVVSKDQQPKWPAESSRDSRRMAQVARQLISLSEKKWWQ